MKIPLHYPKIKYLHKAILGVGIVSLLIFGGVGLACWSVLFKSVAKSEAQLFALGGTFLIVSSIGLLYCCYNFYHATEQFNRLDDWYGIVFTEEGLTLKILSGFNKPTVTYIPITDLMEVVASTSLVQFRRVTDKWYKPTITIKRRFFQKPTYQAFVTALGNKFRSETNSK